MADYGARINVTANTSQADRELRRLQDRLNAVQSAADIEIGDLIRAGGIQRSISTINQLDQAVVALRSTIRTINAPGGGQLADQIRTAATASNQFFDSLIAGNRTLSNTISGLRDQSNAFANLAANINSATDRFTDYVQGAQSAQDKGLRPLFRQFEALRSLYEEGITGRGMEINPTEMGIGLFEQLRREVPQTEAALRAFSSELSRIRSLIGSESVAAFGIEQQIIDIEQQLLTIEQNRLETRAAINRQMSAPVQSALAGMGGGPNPFGISDEQINETLNNRAEEYQRQQDELLSLNRVLSEMSGKKYDPFGISDEQINQGLDQRAAAYERQVQEISSVQAALSSMEGKKYDPFGISDQQINAALNQRADIYQQQARDISSLQQALGAMESRKVNWATAFGINEADIAADRANRLAKEWENLPAAAAKAREAADALNSFKFETLARDADAYTRALLNQQRALDEYTDSANRAANAAKELGYGGDIPALRPAGFTDQDVRIKNLLDDQKEATRIATAYQIEEDKIISQLAIDNIQRELTAELDKIDAILAAEVAAGEAWWKKEKARLDEKTRIQQEQARQQALPFLERQFGPRGSRAISEGLIGGAFPLLFGQGIGASVGGGLGGAVGGFAGGGLGFGLSLVGTALGTAFDTAIQGAKDLATALEKPVENFDKLKERALFSSKALEKQIQKTIEYGDTATASALIQSDINKRLGGATVKSLQDLASANDEFTRATSASTAQLQVFIANMIGLAPILRGLASGAKINELQSRAGTTISQLRSEGKTGAAGKLEEVFGRTRFTNITPQEYAAQLEAAILEAEKNLKPIQIKIDPKQIDESRLNALQKQLQLIDITQNLKDQARSASREQQDIDKERADITSSYEESLGQIRKKIEDEIAAKRFATIQKENELLDVQGQIRLKSLQIANQASIAQAGVGQRPEIEQAAKEIAQLTAQFSEQQLSAEEEAARIKREASLEASKIDYEALNLKANIEKEVSNLNIETARKIATINQQVRQKNEEYDSNRFKLEKAIAEVQLKQALSQANEQIAAAEVQLKIAKESGAAGAENAKYFRNILSVYNAQKDVLLQGQKDISNITAPARLRGVGGIAIGGVSTSGLDQATADFKAATDNYVAAQLRLNELDVVKNAQDFALGIQDFANKTDAMLEAIQTKESDAEIERLRYIELINAGLTDTVAQKIIELETTKRISLALYDVAIAQLESKIVAGDVTIQVDAQNRAYRDQIKILKQRKDALEGKFGEFDTATGAGTGAIGAVPESEKGKQIQDFIAQATAQLNDLESVAIRVSQSIGDAVGNSLANGISGLIEGTTTAKQIFADFLKSVGQILVQEGTKMIATYIAIGIAKAFAGLLGGGGNMGGQNYFNPKTGLGVAGPNFGLAKGGVFDSNGISAFAKGGMFSNSIVSSPTLFKFADGGAMRTGVMGEAGPEAIMPLRRGSDGRLGVEARGLREAMNGGSGAPVLNMSFETTNIGGVEYVSRDQLEAAMAATRKQASADGAKRGMSMTLDKLQQSPQTRSRLGIRS